MYLSPLFFLLEVVITRHLFSFILAGVVAASTIFPASAWTRDSFISGGEEYEDTPDVALSDIYAAPRRAPRMDKVSAADQAALDANTTGKLVVPATLPTSVDGTFQVMSKHYYKSSAGGVSVESDYWDTVIASFSSGPFFDAGGWLHALPDVSCVYTPNVSDPHDMTRGLAAFCDRSSGVFPSGYTIAGSGGGNLGTDSWSFVINYDVSAYGSSAFSLDGLDIWAVLGIGPYWPNWTVFMASSVDVLVDGQQVLSLSRGSLGHIDFGGYVFSGSSNVSTISFRWTLPFSMFVSSDPAYAGTYRFSLRSILINDDPKGLTISFLDGQDVINAQNNKTKNDINKHEEYESQWTGSMTENFNALGFDSFSWSDSLVSGFSLFSGIFMDIWRALGGATILFTFPLLLGVALLLIGRISRSGGRSGSGKGGGDGG